LTILTTSVIAFLKLCGEKVTHSEAGTLNQELNLFSRPSLDPENPLHAALMRLEKMLDEGGTTDQGS
jgi:hypothetical protein